MLWDGKGRGVRPRRHAVALLPEALAALAVMTTPMLSDYVFSLTRGQTPADGGAVRRAVQDLAARRVAGARRSSRSRLATCGGRWKPGWLRLVCPPRRAQLQSHSLGGVQAWHYDRHGYEEEKRAALERLRGLLEPGVMARLPAWRQVTMLAELLLQLFPGNRRIHLLQKNFATGLALLGGVFGFGKGQRSHG